MSNNKLDAIDLGYTENDVKLKFGGMNEVRKTDGDIRQRLKLFDPDSSVLGNWNVHRRVNLTGNNVSSSKELAELFSVYRHPNIEHLHYVYTNRNGDILGHNAISAGLAHSSPALRGSRVKGFHDIRDRMQRLGASNMYLIHNHPSGDPAASELDISTAKIFANEVRRGGFEFGGSLILNHDKFTYLKVLANGYPFPNGQNYVPGLNSFTDYKKAVDDVYSVENNAYIPYDGGVSFRNKDNPVLLNPETVAGYVGSFINSKDTSAMIFVDSLCRCSGWVPVNEKTCTLNTAHRTARQVGASGIFFVTDDRNMYNKMSDMVIDDAVSIMRDIGGKGSRRTEQIFDVLMIDSGGLFSKGGYLSASATNNDFRKALKVIERQNMPGVGVHNISVFESPPSAVYSVNADLKKMGTSTEVGSLNSLLSWAKEKGVDVGVTTSDENVTVDWNAFSVVPLAEMGSYSADVRHKVHSDYMAAIDRSIELGSNQAEYVEFVTSDLFKTVLANDSMVSEWEDRDLRRKEDLISEVYYSDLYSDDNVLLGTFLKSGVGDNERFDSVSQQLEIGSKLSSNLEGQSVGGVKFIASEDLTYMKVGDVVHCNVLRWGHKHSSLLSGKSFERSEFCKQFDSLQKLRERLKDLTGEDFYIPDTYRTKMGKKWDAYKKVESNILNQFNDIQECARHIVDNKLIREHSTVKSNLFLRDLQERVVNYNMAVASPEVHDMEKLLVRLDKMQAELREKCDVAVASSIENANSYSSLKNIIAEVYGIHGVPIKEPVRDMIRNMLKTGISAYDIYNNIVKTITSSEKHQVDVASMIRLSESEKRPVDIPPTVDGVELADEIDLGFHTKFNYVKMKGDPNLPDNYDCPLKNGDFVVEGQEVYDYAAFNISVVDGGKLVEFRTNYDVERTRLMELLANHTINKDIGESLVVMAKPFEQKVEKSSLSLV